MFKKKKGFLFPRRTRSLTTFDITVGVEDPDEKSVRTLFGDQPLKCNLDQISCFLFRAMDFVSRNAHVEGIFRISGDFAKKKELVSRLNAGVILTEEIMNEQDDCHVIADLIKEFFKKLPEPMMKPIFDHVLNNDDFELQNESEIRDKLVENMAPYQLILLHRLFQLLFIVVQNQETSKMGASNLSLLFTAVMYHRPLMEFMKMKGGNAYKRGLAITAVFINKYDYFFRTKLNPKFMLHPELSFKMFLLAQQNDLEIT